MTTNSLTWIPKRCAHGIYEYEASNGLKLLLVPQKGLGVTTANITFEVGSQNEGLGLSGGAHWLEHALFKGSKKYQGKNGMWKLENMGAYLNAQTYLSRTNFFEVIETKHLNDVIVREADRMYEPLLTADLLQSEMTVIRNEYERGENNDFEVLHKRMMATAFMAHGYHHSTIGWKSDIENVSAEDLQKFHEENYVPQNATYTFVGAFDPEKVKEMVGKAFAVIPKGKDVKKMYTVEPDQLGPRRVLVQRPSNSSILGIGFKAPHGLHRDAIALKVLGHLLTQGPTANAAPLKREGVMHDVIASWERMKDPYLFVLWATTNYATQQALDTAETKLLHMLQTLKAPSQETLDVAKNAIKFSWKDEMEGTRGLAMAINESIARGDAFDAYNRFDVLASITSDDIVRVAKQYFDTNKMTVAHFLPGKVTPSAYVRLDYKKPDYDVCPSCLTPPEQDSINFTNASSVSNGIAFTKYNNTSKTHLLVSMDSPKSTYTAQEYMARAVLSKMMMKGANVQKNGRNLAFKEKNISEFLQQNGINRDINNSAHGVMLQLSIPNDDVRVTNKMMKLMKAELESPLLDTTSFTYIKNRMVAELNGQRNDVNETAKTHFFQALFAKGDANYRHSNEDMVHALHQLSHSDITREHDHLMKEAYTKLTVMGPELIRLCSIKTSNNHLNFERKLNTAAPAIQKVDLEGKTSCTVIMGMVAHPSMDLTVAVGVLGNGFSGRLMKQVRDKEGLTYGIGARVKKMNGTGIFHVTATFAPSLLDKGMNSSMDVINQWFEANLTEEEVQIQKDILIGGRNVHFDQPAAVASTVHRSQIDGSGIGSIDNFKEKVENVTLESAKRAIRELNRANFKTVIAGTFTI